MVDEPVKDEDGKRFEGLGEVTYLDEVIDRIQNKLALASVTVQQKVLPGVRGKIIKQISDVNVLLNAVSEVLEKSKMGTKLGFIKKPDGIQPVMRDTTNDTQGSDL